MNELFDEAELQVRNEGFENYSFSVDARERIFDLSNGHPHFVHQFGYCAFEKCCEDDGTDSFSVKDTHVIQGAFEARGALELIGDVYFRTPFNSIRDDQVSLFVLDSLSDRPRYPMSCSEIQELNFFDLAAVKDAVARLVNVGLVFDPEETGQYRLRHPCFGFWIKARRPQLSLRT